MKVAGIEKESLIDGPGINYTIFTQGCPHRCPGCHNPSTWDITGGYELGLSIIKKDIENSPLLTGITFSGGEPMRQYDEVKELAEWAQKKGLAVILYTGYRMRNSSGVFDKHCPEGLLPAFKLDAEDLKLFDYIIDGPFILEKRDLNLLYMGSKNQRLLKREEDF